MNLQSTTLSLRYKMCIFTLGLIVFGWFFAVVVLLPAQQRIVALEKQLRIEQDWIKVVQDFGTAYPEPAKFQKLLDEKLISFDRLLPAQVRVSDFLSQCEAAAKASGVQLLSLKPGAFVNKNKFRDCKMELVIRGNYFQTMNFIKNLEDGPRFCTITQIAIQSKSGQVESKLSVNIYSFGVASPPTTTPAGK